MSADNSVTEKIPAIQPTITTPTVEVNPLVDALNKLVESSDAKIKATLEAQNAQFATAMTKQAEALQGIAAKLGTAPVPATQPATPTPAPAAVPSALPPGAASREVNLYPIIQRMFNDVVFRDRVVALHAAFPSGS